MMCQDIAMRDSSEFGDTYRLVWLKPKAAYVAEIRNYTLAAYVGELRNYTLDRKGYRRIQIVLDDILIKKINMRFLASNWNDTGPTIYVSTAFMMLSCRLREAGIWHEVGHIHHEHYLRTDFLDQRQLRDARRDAAKQGKILPHEEEADRFAVKQIGAGPVLDFLEYVLSTRPSGGDINDFGRLELGIRIAAIRSNKSEAI